MAGDGENLMRKVLMIINIIVGVFTCFLGVNFIVNFFDYGLSEYVGIRFGISLLFYGLCILVLGLIIIGMELRLKADMIEHNFGILQHHIGRGSFVFFTSIIGWAGTGGNPYDDYSGTSVVGSYCYNDVFSSRYHCYQTFWINTNFIHWGSILGLVSAILHLVAHFCFKDTGRDLFHQAQPISTH